MYLYGSRTVVKGEAVVSVMRPSTRSVK
jgi:hypothetical protein